MLTSGNVIFRASQLEVRILGVGAFGSEDVPAAFHSLVACDTLSGIAYGRPGHLGDMMGDVGRSELLWRKSVIRRRHPGSAVCVDNALAFCALSDPRQPRSALVT